MHDHAAPRSLLPRDQRAGGSELTAWLVVANAGHVWGLDGWFANRRIAGSRAAAIG
jgi:hypothetical protein